MSDQGERVAALRQGLNINPSALMGVPGAKPPPVRPYLTESAGGASPASQPPAETAPPPPRPPKPRSSTLTEQDSAFDGPSSPPVIVNPYAPASNPSSSSASSKRQSVTVNPSPLSLSDPAAVGLGPPPPRPARIQSVVEPQPSPSAFTSSAPSLPSSGSPALSHPTKSRVAGSAAQTRRLPTNQNAVLREKEAEIAFLKQQLAQAAAGGGGGVVVQGPSGEAAGISASQLVDLQKERDNFKLVAQKLQKELRASKAELEQARHAGSGPLSGDSADTRLKELEEQLKSRESTIARLRSEQSRRDAELVQMDTAPFTALQNPTLERERLAKQREELDQMRADEAKAEVAKLRNQIVQLKRIMERRISTLEENLEEETKNSVNLLAEKRQIEEQLRHSTGATAPAYFRAPTSPPQARGGVSPSGLSPTPERQSYLAEDDDYPELDLRRNKSELFKKNPSQQLADVPLLSAADFSNPPPLRPKSQAVAASRPTPMCASCIIS